MQNIYNKLFDNNKIWVKKKLDADSEYFSRLAKGQNPPVLWIGCSDSRVPANEITGTEPGEIFVHRNIANMVIHTDMNLLSVLDYAVNALNVSHVIVCGHYGCGGIIAAVENTSVGLTDNWLRHIKDVYRLHKTEVDSIISKEEKCRRMVEINIKEQVFSLAKTSIVQQAWKRNTSLEIHGIVYDIANGFLNDLDLNITNDKQLDEIYNINLDNILSNEKLKRSV